jgi:hypothetical protein
VKILTKQQNYKLWASGAFGNRFLSWRSVAEWRASGFSGKVALRYLGGGGGGRCTYNLLPEEVEDEALRWVGEGADASKIMVNQMVPDQDRYTTIQGEFYNGVFNDVVEPFLHTFYPAPMRTALAHQSLHTHGLRGRLLLKHFMTASSWEDFQVLLDQYPDHVLEVSVFSRCLGNIPGRNATVWEVRRY